MVIHWLIPGIYKVVEDLSKSNTASIRMRAGLVGMHAHDIEFKLSAGDHINTKADIVVVGKIGGDCQNGRASLWMNQISQANKQSKKIILDYTDHHLESSSSTIYGVLGLHLCEQLCQFRQAAAGWGKKVG